MTEMTRFSTALEERYRIQRQRAGGGETPLNVPGSRAVSIDIADSLVVSVIPLPDGWAWIPATKDRVVVQRGGKTSEI